MTRELLLILAATIPGGGDGDDAFNETDGDDAVSEKDGDDDKDVAMTTTAATTTTTTTSTQEQQRNGTSSLRHARKES